MQEDLEQEDILEYVDELAEQLAAMCRDFAPNVALVLEIAAKLARVQLQ